MGNKPKKPRFVVDIPSYASHFSKKYGNKCVFYNVAEVAGRINALDPDIFSACSSEDIHIITQNFDHFKALRKSKPTSKVGIVGVSSPISTKKVDMFGKLLKEKPGHDDYKSVMVSLTESGVRYIQSSTE